MTCAPGYIYGPGMVPFWGQCYAINSDMGAHLTSSLPALRADSNDLQIIFKRFGVAPTDTAGRQRVAEFGPDLFERASSRCTPA